LASTGLPRLIEARKAPCGANNAAMDLSAGCAVEEVACMIVVPEVCACAAALHVRRTASAASSAVRYFSVVNVFILALLFGYLSCLIRNSG